MSRGAQATQALHAQLLPYLRRLLAGVHAGQARAGERKVGAHLSPWRGSVGSEFADHRPYQPGDDLRQVNARLWARLGKPMVRQYQQEQTRSFLVVVDRSASMAMGVPTKWDCAWPLAATLVCAAAGNHDRCTLLVANDKAIHVPMHMPLAAVDALATTELVGKTDLAATASAIVSLRGSVHTDVVWISDFLDRLGVEPALDRLRQSRCTPWLVCTQGHENHVVADDELVRLRDVETAETTTATLTQARVRHYEQAQHAYYETLERFCMRTAVPLLRVGPYFEREAERLLRALGLRA